MVNAFYLPFNQRFQFRAAVHKMIHELIYAPLVIPIVPYLRVFGDYPVYLRDKLRCFLQRCTRLSDVSFDV